MAASFGSLPPCIQAQLTFLVGQNGSGQAARSSVLMWYLFASYSFDRQAMLLPLEVESLRFNAWLYYDGIRPVATDGAGRPVSLHWVIDSWEHAPDICIYGPMWNGHCLHEWEDEQFFVNDGDSDPE